MYRLQILTKEHQLQQKLQQHYNRENQYYLIEQTNTQPLLQIVSTIYLDIFNSCKNHIGSKFKIFVQRIIQKGISLDLFKQILNLIKHQQRIIELYQQQFKNFNTVFIGEADQIQIFNQEQSFYQTPQQSYQNLSLNEPQTICLLNQDLSNTSINYYQVLEDHFTTNQKYKDNYTGSTQLPIEPQKYSNKFGKNFHTQTPKNKNQHSFEIVNIDKKIRGSLINQYDAKHMDQQINRQSTLDLERSKTFKCQLKEKKNQQILNYQKKLKKIALRYKLSTNKSKK